MKAANERGESLMSLFEHKNPAVRTVARLAALPVVIPVIAVCFFALMARDLVRLRGKDKGAAPPKGKKASGPWWS